MLLACCLQAEEKLARKQKDQLLTAAAESCARELKAMPEAGVDAQLCARLRGRSAATGITTADPL